MKLKKIAVVGVMGLTMLALTACGGAEKASASYNDGTYAGEGKGFGGAIKVELVVEAGEITELNVVEHAESEGISDPAFEGIKAQLIEKQSDELDVVSGATKTSEGLIEAIKAALPQATK